MRIIALLSVLMMFSAGSAITATMGLDRSQVDLGGTVVISHSFSISEPSPTNFSAMANGILIFNRTTFASSFSGEYEWNVSNTPAGNYTVQFTVSAENGETASTTEKLEIVPRAMLAMVTYDRVHAFSNITTKTYNLQNTGNVPLEVSVLPTRLYSVSPLYFALGVDETQDITVQIQKTSSISASLSVRGQNGTLSHSINLDIDIIVPEVSVNLTDVYAIPSGDFSLLHLIAVNDGNIDQNFSFIIVAGDESFDRFLEVDAQETVEHNFTLPTTSSVKSVQMGYIDSDGLPSTLSVQLAEAGIFDRISELLGDTTLRGIVITFLVIFVLYMLWKVVKR